MMPIWGGRSGGKAGLGSENKIPFLAAVPLTGDEHPLRVKLGPVSGFTFRTLWDWSPQHPAPGCAVYSEGPACFNAFNLIDCARQPTVVGGRKPKGLP